MNRRRFAKLAAMSSLSWGSKKVTVAADRPVWTRPLSVHIFSKHLQFLDYAQMADVVARLGFDGIDLSVRPGGHVEPENVRDDLPKAVEAIGDRGLLSVMMTTRVTNAADPLHLDVLKSGVDQGFIDDDLTPVESKVSNPIKFLNTMMQFVKLPEPGHIVHEPMNIPFHKIF